MGSLARWFLIFRCISAFVMEPVQKPENYRQCELMRHVSATLGSGNIRDAVKLPQGEDVNEWIAVNSNRTQLSFKNL